MININIPDSKMLLCVFVFQLITYICIVCITLSQFLKNTEKYFTIVNVLVIVSYETIITNLRLREHVFTHGK